MSVPEPQKELTIKELDALFGADGKLSESVGELTNLLPLTYRVLTGSEKNSVISKVRQKINSQTLTVSGPDQQQRWETGWKENLAEFQASGYDERTLLPKYVHPDSILRLRGEYIKPDNPKLEQIFYQLLREWLFAKYFSAIKNIYEFGCGTGHNLVALAKKYPDKLLHGLDWAPQSKLLLDLLRTQKGYAITGQVFNMFQPDLSVKLEPQSGVLMVGALEQLGADFEQILSYLLAQKPAIVVQINQFIELYDKNDQLDQLAIEFEQRRNYLNGYLPRLQQLAQEGKIEILALRRVPFGSLFHDGYSFVVWRPI